MKPLALVTGGSRGIGLGCARALARRGFDLAVNGARPQDQVGDALAELEALGARVLYCQGDVSAAADRAAILDKIRSEAGRLDILVNNAGIAPTERRDLLEATEESFERVFAVNAKGPYFLTQAVANWMIEQRRERPDDFLAIINIGSISATVASVNRGEYCMAKAAVAMTTRLFAARLGERDIPVYEAQPGITATDMTAGVKEKYDRLLAEGLAVTRRWGTPEDVGKLVAALASGELPYSTGACIPVDGGLTLPRL